MQWIVQVHYAVVFNYTIQNSLYASTCRRLHLYMYRIKVAKSKIKVNIVAKDSDGIFVLSSHRPADSSDVGGRVFAMKFSKS